MTILQFMSEHPFLTFLLAAIAGDVVIKVAAIIRGRE